MTSMVPAVVAVVVAAGAIVAIVAQRVRRRRVDVAIGAERALASARSEIADIAEQRRRLGAATGRPDRA